MASTDKKLSPFYQTIQIALLEAAINIASSPWKQGEMLGLLYLLSKTEDVPQRYLPAVIHTCEMVQSFVATAQQISAPEEHLGRLGRLVNEVIEELKLRARPKLASTGAATPGGLSNPVLPSI